MCTPGMGLATCYHGCVSSHNINIIMAEERIQGLYDEADRIAKLICKETIQAFKECIKKQDWERMDKISRLGGAALNPYMEEYFDALAEVMEIVLAEDILKQRHASYDLTDCNMEILRNMIPDVKLDERDGTYKFEDIKEAREQLLASEWFKALQ